MSISSEISRLQTAKSDIASAIEGKGVTVSEDTKLDGMAVLISAIQPDASSITDVVQVENGGTGKSSVTAGNFLVGNGTEALVEKTPSEVIADFSADLASQTETVTATSSGWTGDGPYTQIVSVNIMTETCNAIVGLSESATFEQRNSCRAAIITPTAQGTNTVTLTADGIKPVIDLPIAVTILEVG